MGDNGTKGTNGRGADGRFLPGSGGGPGRPRVHFKISDHLRNLANEVINGTQTRAEELARAIFHDALDKDVSSRLKIHARDFIGDRLDPVNKDAELRPIIPLDVTIYDQRTVAMLQELSDATHGAPTTEDVLRKLRAMPIPRLSVDEDIEQESDDDSV